MNLLHCIYSGTDRSRWLQKVTVHLIHYIHTGIVRCVWLRKETVHTLHMTLQVMTSVELMTTVFATVWPYTSMYIQMTLQVILVILATEMDSTYWAVNSL